MSVYVGIDVHRKRSQVAVINQDGEVLVNRQRRGKATTTVPPRSRAAANQVTGLTQHWLLTTGAPMGAETAGDDEPGWAARRAGPRQPRHEN
jgi:hypothetical protein